ncbi:unnamed protein product [Rotaria magnacalcarata]|uniref:Uncharacterized protein n=1 Tax=Rotaria magnacalcarata TaxID=392030 RepID=A0A816PJ62_9BILA|nr:unnamed protein product [Rotaria magnacalcarata]CAF2072842.1 unnamed protein product [Rotaria magnacalcarata]
MRELGNSAHQTIEQLRRNVHVVRVFDQWDACIDFITALDEKDIVYLVIQAGYFKDELLFVLDSIHQIKSNRSSTQIERYMRQNTNMRLIHSIFEHMPAPIMESIVA